MRYGSLQYWHCKDIFGRQLSCFQPIWPSRGKLLLGGNADRPNKVVLIVSQAGNKLKADGAIAIVRSHRARNCNRERKRARGWIAVTRTERCGNRPLKNPDLFLRRNGWTDGYITPAERHCVPACDITWDLEISFASSKWGIMFSLRLKDFCLAWEATPLPRPDGPATAPDPYDLSATYSTSSVFAYEFRSCPGVGFYEAFQTHVARPSFLALLLCLLLLPRRTFLFFFFFS